MGQLDSLRTWAERHPDAPANDWRVAQGNGWNTDAPTGDVTPVLDRVARAHTTNPRPAVRVTDPCDGPDRPGPLFLVARPRADRLVYVLLRQLAEINPDAATKGRTWYDSVRENLTVDAGSAWITRIRAKIAEGVPTAPIENVNAALAVTKPAPTARHDVWAEWRAMATELAATGGHPSGTRFAIDNTDTSANDVSFWWISVSKKTGFAKLRQMVGGGTDDLNPVDVRMTPQQMIAIGNKIKSAGPREAMIRYGQLVKHCGDCGRSLSNEESRRVGIGPKCRTRA